MCRFVNIFLVHLRRFELLSRFRHTDLNRARLPIPPQVQMSILNFSIFAATLSAAPARPFAVPEIKDFDRCTFSPSLHLPPAALGIEAANSATGANNCLIIITQYV